MSQRLPVSFTRRASKHVDEAGQWWRENRAKAPEALREELDQALQLIASHPENLFAADASFFPSLAAVNPGLTIVAQALRAADHIRASHL